MNIVNVLAFWEHPLFKLGTQAITPAWLVSISLTLVLFVFGIYYCKKILRHWLLAKLGISSGNSVVISTLVTYGIAAIVAVMILQWYGLDITSLAVVLGGLGVGIGFGLQDITKNLVSGVTLLIENKLQVGDYVEFSDLAGYIKEISIRSTIISTFDGGDVVIPNSNLTTSEVLNWSYNDISGRISLPISVAYSSDPVLVTETLLQAAHSHPAVRIDPLPRVIFKSFGDSALEFELWAWVDRIDQAILIKSSLNFTINHYFHQAGIEIPFPQRDLWLRNPETLSQPITDLASFSHSHFEPIQSDARLSPPSGQNLPQRLPSTPETSEINQIDHSQEPTCNQSLPRLTLRQCLARIPYFQACNPLSLLQIIQSGYQRFLPINSVLFKEEESANAMYVLLSGQIEAYSHKLKRRVKVYHPGEMFGEVPILLNLPYIVDARALTDCHIFIIPKKQLETLLQVAPYFAEIVTQEMVTEREIYDPIHQKLQDLGLIKTMEQKDLLAWVKTRVRDLLTLPGTSLGKSL